MNENNLITTEFKNEDIETCLKVLESFATKSEQLTLLTHEQRLAMFKAAGSISRPDREEVKKRQKDVKTVVNKKKYLNMKVQWIGYARVVNLFQKKNKRSY